MPDKIRILIVDDDELMRKTFSDIFQKKGFAVDTVGTGREAEEKVKPEGNGAASNSRSHKADLFNIALVDIKLPDMEGTKVLEALKRISPDIEVIMVTAYASLGTSIEALNKGAYAYIIKPVKIDEMMITLQRALEKQGLIIENRKLLSSLKEAKEELEKWNNELEQRVEARTKELKEAQEKLLGAERLAAIGGLATAVGNELRNPLTAIKNVAFYIKKKTAQEETAKPEGNGAASNSRSQKTDSKMQGFLKILDEEIASQEKTINDLLRLSHQERPALRRIDVNSILERALALAQGGQKVRREKELGKDIPHALGDTEQILQAFSNIILNALQAMGEEGRLKVGTAQKQESIEIEFSDTGPGIKKEYLEKIFDPLFTTKVRGIGLGLAVAKSIVERHNGSIEVKSEEGKGATFIVRLPIG